MLEVGLQAADATSHMVMEAIEQTTMLSVTVQVSLL